MAGSDRTPHVSKSVETTWSDDTKPVIITEVVSNERSVAENGTVEELGYTTVYRRVFRSIGNVCMVISLTSPLLAIVLTAFYQVAYCGYWGLSWGWIIPSVLVLPEVLAVAELTSSMPLNGSFYWWSGALAPPKYSNMVSFVSGWLNIMSMFSATAAFVYAVASTVGFSVAVYQPDFVLSNAQLLGMSFAVLFVWTAVMAMKLEHITLIFMVMAGLVLLQTVIFIIGLPTSHAVHGRPFASAKDVFGSFHVYSDWDASVAIPYSWFAFMWVNSAWMCPVYVAEETKNASTEVPKSVISTYIITTVAGFVVCIISALCITDISAAAYDQSGYPLVTLIVEHWGRKWTAAFFLSMLPIGFFGGSGTLVTYASQIAAFARDGGLPYSERFSTVHPRLNLPIYSVGLLVIGTSLILLFALSEEASSIIYSLSVVAGLLTYILPIAFRLFAGRRWVPGPFSLGRWSIPCAAFAVPVQWYLIVMECFPPDRKFNAASMNYDSVITGASILLAFVLYWWMRKSYKGINQESLERWRMAHQASHEDDK